MELRVFAAVELPRETIRALAAFRRAFTEAAPGWAAESWVRDRNLHLTLKFIAALPEEVLGDVGVELSAACAAIDPFRAALSGPRAVPSERRASMIWAGFGEGHEQCVALAAAVDGALAGLGIPAEERPFKSHVTLVRARRDRRAPRGAMEAAWSDAFGGADGEALSMSVASVTLFSSSLGQGPPVYERLGRYPLGTTAL